MKVSYPLRIDEELMNQVKFLAERDSRSLNKEFEYLIKRSIITLNEDVPQPAPSK